MFIGREKELTALEKIYASDRFEFLVLYGRRRIGKTALLNEFTRDKRTVFMTGVENDAAVNLRSLSKAISEVWPELPADAFSSFQAALEYLFRRAQNEKLVLVIDEYPYVARADKSLASVLQMLIDRSRDTSHLKLVLCGSSMSFMEDEVLAYKAPLYGRRTGQIRLRPFEFPDARRFVPRMDPAEQLTVYGATGGVASYLLEFDDTLDLYENLLRTFLSTQSVLYAEPESVLRQELREPAGYSALLASIAGGASKFSQIVSQTQMTSASGDAHLRRLMELGLVARRSPYGAVSSRKSLYEIADGAFRFWYRFVLPNVSRIERGNSGLVLEEIREQLSDFTARTFEEVCQQYLWHLLGSGESPVNFQDLGAWWGTDPRTRTVEEIDIVGKDALSRSILTAECKWRNEPTGTGVLRKLRERTALVAGGAKPHLFLFSKNGFTDECRSDAGEDHSVMLVSYPQLVSELAGDD